MSRVARFVKVSGTKPHRDHRSKKGRKQYPTDVVVQRKKKKLEELKIQDLTDPLDISDN